MRYAEHYDRLIDRARGRERAGYMERHHVVPKCRGGSDAPDNLVWLTAEEHFVAHQLLVKIHPTDRRLMWAVTCLTGSTRKKARNNKAFGWLRRRFAEVVGKANRGRVMSAEVRAAMSAQRKGRKHPGGYTKRQAGPHGLKGKPKSLEHRKALAAAKLGRSRGPQSAEHRQRLSESNRRARAVMDKSVYHTPEYRAAQSEQMRRVWNERRSGGTAVVA